MIIYIIKKYIWQPPEAWDGGIGHVSKEMIQTHCPAPASDIQVIFHKFLGIFFVGLFHKPKPQIPKCAEFNLRTFYITLKRPNQLNLRSQEFSFTPSLRLKFMILQILRCGPPGMNKAVAAHLEALGYDSKMQFEF